MWDRRVLADPTRDAKRVLAGVLAATLGATVTVAGIAAAATPAKPVVVSVIASPSPLPAAGGTVRLTIKHKHAKTCTISVSLKLAGFPKTTTCTASVSSLAITIPANPAASARTIRFTVVAKGPAGKSKPRAATVSQATDMGTIGSTLDVHDLQGDTLAVTMTQIIDPATGANEFDTPNSGDRFVAIEMTLENPSSATITDDANGDTTVIGTDSQAYDADFDSVAECTNFAYGQFTLLPGASEDGCVLYQLPVGVDVKAIQFVLGGNTANVAQWNA
jgi:hypothetical protein